MIRAHRNTNAPASSTEQEHLRRTERKSSAGHLSQRLARKLEADIAAGRFKDSGQLPRETTLAKQLGVSRHTLRRAIAALVKKGSLRSMPNIGTFLAPMRIPFSLNANWIFSETLEQAGLVPGGRLLSQKRVMPPATIARMLEVALRSEVIELVHVRTANDLPLSYVNSWVPADRFPRIGDLYAASGSFRRALAQLGVPSYRRKSMRIFSRLADADERAGLDLAAGAIVIVVESVNVDAAGEPTHVALYRFAADRVDLIVEP